MIYTLSQILSYSAAKVPERTAFKDGRESVTFSEADLQTNQIAQFLLGKGLKKSDRVGIFLNRNVRSALAVHGILKAGGVFVPIDIDAPAERIRYIIGDCNISFIISEQELVHKLDSALHSVSENQIILGASSLQSDHQWFAWESLNDCHDRSPDVKVLSSDLAYIMYTSGTTGYPKGIMHTHYSGLSYAKLSSDLYDLSDTDVVANHSPLHFDMSTFGYLTAPFAGATCLILGKQYSVFPASLSQLIEDERVTIWYSVPLVLQQLLDRGDLVNRDLTSIRWVHFGGEPFPVHQLNRFMEFCPEATFSNVYGPAEVNQCTFFNHRGKLFSSELMPLGFIWNDTDYLIINQNGRKVKEGETGELLIHSSTMMSGYWNNRERTRESFYEVENSSGFKRKFYKTGDLVKEDADGLLYFMGRKDRQIKTRGHRVELNEIEETILRHDEIEQAAVYTFRYNGINEIFATVVLRSGVLLNDIEQNIQKSLPKYSVPKLMLEAEELPRTSAGKVDYKKLSQSISDIYDSKNQSIYSK